jgi:hypothetical protein
MQVIGTEGRKKAVSKISLLVSCRQMTSHLHSLILLLRALHFLSSLIPLIFQQRTFQVLCVLIHLRNNQREVNTQKSVEIGTEK